MAWHQVREDSLCPEELVVQVDVIDTENASGIGILGPWPTSDFSPHVGDDFMI